jgi:hypothetical protein
MSIKYIREVIFMYGFKNLALTKEQLAYIDREYHINSIPSCEAEAKAPEIVEDLLGIKVKCASWNGDEEIDYIEADAEDDTDQVEIAPDLESQLRAVGMSTHDFI